MDSKTFTLSIVTMISVMLLVALIIYAANREQIGKLLHPDTAGSGESGTEAVLEAETGYTYGNFGEQIGDDLKAFLLDDSFFDSHRSSGSIVVTSDNKPPAYPVIDEETESVNPWENLPEPTDGMTGEVSGQEEGTPEQDKEKNEEQQPDQPELETDGEQKPADQEDQSKDQNTETN